MRPNYVGILGYVQKILRKRSRILEIMDFLKCGHVLRLAPYIGVSCNTTRGTL